MPRRVQPRADAVFNRQRVLEAAGAVFARLGLTASLHDVAKAAGVGVATVYRNFPDRDALLDALLEDKIATVSRAVDAALATSDIEQSFRTLMLAAAEARAADRGLFQVAARALKGSSRFQDHVLRLLHTSDEVVERARTAGVVRASFSVADVDLFMLMVGTVADVTRDIDPTAWRRCANQLLDGYRTLGTPDPLEALSFTDAARQTLFSQ